MKLAGYRTALPRITVLLSCFVLLVWHTLSGLSSASSNFLEKTFARPVRVELTSKGLEPSVFPVHYGRICECSTLFLKGWGPSGFAPIDFAMSSSPPTTLEFRVGCCKATCFLLYEGSRSLSTQAARQTSRPLRIERLHPIKGTKPP